MHSIDLVRKPDMSEEILEERHFKEKEIKRKRNLQIIGLILLVLVTLAKFFLYVDPSYGCVIKIYPSLLEFNNLTVKQSLKILKNASPTDYRNLCKNVTTINPNPNCGGYDGGCFYPNTPTTIYSNINMRDPALTAAVLMHEVCHINQFKENRAMAEDECYRKDNEVLKILVIQ